MLLAERYLSLLYNFAEDTFSTGEPSHSCEVTLDELAALFHCTERNVKIIIRKLQEEGWITWHPGRGRGNRSHICFNIERSSFLLNYAKILAQKGEYRQAFEFIHQYEHNPALLDSFMIWLNEQFGIRSQAKDHGGRDIFKLPVYRAPLTLDPGNIFYVFDSHLVRQVFDRLVQYDAMLGKVSPMIAHAWERNEDATEWTFYLRKGVYFHHGKELTAEDVVFTFQRLKYQCMNKWLMSTVEQVEAVDERTVAIRLNQSNYLLPKLLCSSSASIVPSDMANLDEAEFWKLPSGTGPFRIVQWSSSKMELQVNERYYFGRPYLDGVMIVFLPGDIPSSSKVKWEQLISNDSRIPSKAGVDWERIETMSKGCSLMTWNRCKEGPQKSLAFRQAVNLIVDRAGLLQNSGRPGYPARSFIPSEETPLMIQRYDADAAICLLRESGYDGTPITLITKEGDLEDAKWIQSQCASIGVPVMIELVDINLMTRTTDISKQADCLLMCLVFAEDEVCELETFLQEDSYIHQHMDPGLRQWIETVIQELLASESEGKRRALLQQIEYRLQDEAQILFLVHRKLNTYVHPSIRGLDINNFGWMDFKDIWLIPDGKTG